MCANLNSDNWKPLTRKRRAASLTAEALWNIQMEDANSKQNELPGRVPARDSGKIYKADLQQKGQSLRGKKSNAGRKKTASICVHLSKHGRKISDDGDGKVRPMASVVPLVKSESKSTNCTESKQTDSLRNSQILLLPVSLNPSGGTDVPIFTLYPSSLRMNLPNCVDVSNLNPVLNVVPVVPNLTTDKIAPHAEPFGKMKYRNPLSAVRRDQSCEVREDQVEPLNLKLGESSIPSKRMIGSKIKVENRSTKNSFKHASVSVWLAPKSLQSSKVKTQKTAKDCKLGRYQDQHKMHKEISSFEAYSPSSESCSSIEADPASLHNNNNGKGRRRRKPCIKLRSKAALPPGKNVVPSKLPEKQKCNDNNYWKWDGESYNALVFSVETGKPTMRQCYPSMRRKSESIERSGNLTGNEDDVIMVHDCVVMRADADERPYIAKVAALWQHPMMGKMMISLLWFYRPEHIEDVRAISGCTNDAELFASRHLDEISVACVEDKCYVLTLNQYCRYTGESAGAQHHVGANDGRRSIPAIQSACDSTAIPTDVDSSLVYFCRKYYDIKTRRLLKAFPSPTSLF